MNHDDTIIENLAIEAARAAFAQGARGPLDSQEDAESGDYWALEEALGRETTAAERAAFRSAPPSGASTASGWPSSPPMNEVEVRRRVFSILRDRWTQQQEGRTSAELARHLGVSRQMVTQWVTGTGGRSPAPWDVIGKLGQELGCSITYTAYGEVQLNFGAERLDLRN